MHRSRICCATLLATAALAPHIAIAGAAVCTATSTGLVAYYPADGTAEDLAGGNDGTLQNGADFAPGWSGQAFSLDGVDDYVSAPSAAAIDPTTSGTLAAWINVAGLPSAVGHIMEIIGKGSSGRDFDLQLDPDDRVRLYVAAGNSVASSTEVSTGTWIHFAGAWDSTIGLRMYVNGLLEGKSPALVTRDPSGQELRIGDQPVFGPRRFDGLIDYVRIYDRMLTQEEVANIACGAICGDANDDRSVKATDALAILRHAVGQSVDCPPVRCDTDGGGTITASDALRALKYAVGQSIDMTCPAA